MFVAKALEYTLRRVVLLTVNRSVLLQNTVDDIREGASFGRFGGWRRRYPGGSECRSIFLTVSRAMPNRLAASRWLRPSTWQASRTRRYRSTVYILPPSISKKIEGYRWQSFTPPAAGKSRRFRGLICHRRSQWRRGERAPGTRQIGYQWAYIFSAVRPDTGDDVTLVMPSVNAKVMDLFLALRRYPGPGCARRHDVRRRRLARRARPHRPRQRHLGAVAALQSRTQPRRTRVWLYLRERFLSLRVLDDTEAIIDACCQAWIDLIAEPDRMRTLCAYPWIMKVIS